LSVIFKQVNQVFDYARIFTHCPSPLKINWRTIAFDRERRFIFDDFTVAFAAKIRTIVKIQLFLADDAI